MVDNLFFKQIDGAQIFWEVEVLAQYFCFVCLFLLDLTHPLQIIYPSVSPPREPNTDQFRIIPQPNAIRPYTILNFYYTMWLFML